MNNFNKPKNKILLIVLVVFCIIWLVLSEVVGNMQKKPLTSTISYATFEEMLDEGRVKTITLSSKDLFLTEGGFVDVVYEGEKIKSTDGTGIILPFEFDVKLYKGTLLLPLTSINIEELLKKGVEFDVPPVYSYKVTTTLLTLLPTVFLVIFLLWLTKKQMSMFQNDKGTHEKIAETSILRFSDVAGMTEEKQELQTAIDSLKNGNAYQEKGARPVRGILLEGPPGVGKTMLAKAVAGEAGVKFISYTGSDFVEMFVGLGAQRIRKMYKQALENKPCVIFIDEIDALGQKRNSYGSSSENDNTLIALLSKMDGMSTETGILFIAATNRVDTLDSALLRPGRFDKVIHIGPPKTKEDREAIVNVHLRNKQLADGVTCEQVAKMCFGLTGAEIEQTLSDAVIESFKLGTDGFITLEAVDNAVMKVVTKGIAKGKNHGNSLERVAVHELGHALMNKIVGRNVVKISVQPYTSGVGGVTMIDGDTANSDGLRSKEDIIDDVKVLYGGFVAEQVILGSVSTGASNDIDRATHLLKHFVGSWGFKDDMFLGLNSLISENPMLVKSDDLIKSMNEVALSIREKVEFLLSHEYSKEIIQSLLPKLIKDEVIYDFEGELNKLFEEKPYLRDSDIIQCSNTVKIEKAKI